MHRSGTSALGGTLNLLGLEFGSDLMGADAGNPKGYFENNFVYKLNEKILKESGSAWDDYRFDASDDRQNKRALQKRSKRDHRERISLCHKLCHQRPSYLLTVSILGRGLP